MRVRFFLFLSLVGFILLDFYSSRLLSLLFQIPLKIYERQNLISLSLYFHKLTALKTETFAKLVNHPDPSNASVEIQDVAHWDANGEYKDLVYATRDATKGSDVIVYRIGRDGARAEYWLVGVEGGRLLGVKALAVES